jgi:hypothetical protein
MELNRPTFLAAWEAATPFLQQEALIQDAWWGSITLSEIFATLDQVLASATTVEALFEHLINEPAPGIMFYAALLVLRPLVDPATQPATALAGDMTIAFDAAQVIFGNATISGTVQNAGALIVFGDLTIAGIYGDATWDPCVLAVAGSVRARGIVSSGDFLIQGDVLVADVVYGHYNDYPLLVGGTLRAKILLEDQHYMRSSVLDAQESVSRFDSARLRELFVDDLFGDDGALSTDQLFDRLEQGQPVYRS